MFEGELGIQDATHMCVKKSWVLSGGREYIYLMLLYLQPPPLPVPPTTLYPLAFFSYYYYLDTQHIVSPERNKEIETLLLRTHNPAAI